MIVSDLIAKFLKDNKIKVAFGIIGSANSYIFDSIQKMGYTKLVYVHHEQAAVMAAGAYYRTNGKLAVALVTAGPGAANAITGVVSNWEDSIPTLIISGQEATRYLNDHKELRMLGTQGFEAEKMVKNITKYSTVVSDPSQILYELNKSMHIATSNRPGPCWIDVPFDIQSEMIDDISSLDLYVPVPELMTICDTDDFEMQIDKIIKMIRSAKRPVIMGGHGIRLSGSKDRFRKLVSALKIPTLLTWSGIDLLSEDNDYYFGRPGIYGQRCANFIVQNCDLLLILGSRLALPQTGYNINNYAPSAKIIMVNNDVNELMKYDDRYELSVNVDVEKVITKLLMCEIDRKEEWYQRCLKYSVDFPVIESHHRECGDYVNSYAFINDLSDYLDHDHVIVVGMGTAQASGHQAIKLKEEQTMFSSAGLGEMGWGLPSLIGAFFAAEGRSLLCLMSDGSMMMNLQELQTIINYKIPAKIVIFNNDGYLFIKHTQKMLFGGNYTGVNRATGIGLPDYNKIASALGFEYYSSNNDSLDDFVSCKGPAFYEVYMDPEQSLTPKVSGVLTNGEILPPPIEEMTPLLDVEEVEKNMIIGVNDLSYKIRGLG